MDANRIEPKSNPANVKSKRRDPNKPFYPRKSTSNTDRKRIVKAYLNGALAKNISDMLGVKLSTVYGIVKHYRRTGRVVASERGGNHKKLLSDDAVNSIRNWLEEDCTQSLQQLTDKVWDQYHVREAAKFKDFETTDSMEASQSADDSVAANEYAVFFKEEYLSSSDVDEQCSDGIDIGETVLTHTSGWEQIVEPIKSEDDVAAVNNINESYSTEHEPILDKDISAEELLNPIAANQPNVKHIATHLSSKQQPTANESHLQVSAKTTETCTFTMQMLDEPQIMKTVTVSMPKIQSATDHSIESPVKVEKAPDTCTHCTCFHQLVAEQKKMIAIMSTFEQKIVDGIQQVQETLMNKLKDIEHSVKDKKQ
ncbi:uncharacterized protein LOC128304327 isoform X2 [Anopheles moucheti]|uniref:uncharacterized protein LOC128304327 isoform X2 n=1 Tax=Anopheles moucheti TaxID=186751 RepID=UPI0022F0C21F|nr:uncharacterized protein LOC128304327 isoform X2 [Anopheles moucheti]